jgi:soluble lytic murein transglycosylase-like protein
VIARSDLIAIAKAAALVAALDPSLACALCHHESANWQLYAVRYEPAFYEHYISSMKGLSATEMQLRATSFGLTQIMGQTARELGFDGTYLTELFEPGVNVKVGFMKLTRCINRHPDDVRAALLEYNGRNNPQYPDLVLAHYGDYK